jgi:hypothetical protein
MPFDDSEPPPLVFAHQVIKMLGEHLLGEEVKLTRQAHLSVRVVFRKLGGSWFQVCSGSPKHLSA